ncbi:hypothetical protein VTK56DRAFT_6959 [Thermocarpiscus australiensis]
MLARGFHQPLAIDSFFAFSLADLPLCPIDRAFGISKGWELLARSVLFGDLTDTLSNPWPGLWIRGFQSLGSCFGVGPAAVAAVSRTGTCSSSEPLGGSSPYMDGLYSVSCCPCAESYVFGSIISFSRSSGLGVSVVRRAALPIGTWPGEADCEGNRTMGITPVLLSLTAVAELARPHEPPEASVRRVPETACEGGVG